MKALLATEAKRQNHNSRSSRRLCVWQRVLLCFYVALFALVLPLICWGALAAPGHPHRYPHFIFAVPILAATSVVEEGRKPQTHVTMPPVHHGEHREQPASVVQPDRVSLDCGWLTTNVIPGRATPTLLLFAILLLVFFAAWSMRPFDLPRFAICQRLLLPQSILLPVPLPPPRPFRQQH